MNWIIARGLLIPFLGTSLGSALVFFMKRELSTRLQNSLSGFASAVLETFAGDNEVLVALAMNHHLFWLSI